MEVFTATTEFDLLPVKASFDQKKSSLIDSKRSLEPLVELQKSAKPHKIEIGT